MLGLEYQPPSGSGLGAVAEVARRRQIGWRVLGDTFGAPTPDWIQQLRDGRTHADLESAISWRDGQLTQFVRPMIALATFTRVSRRRTQEHDQQMLSAEFARLEANNRDAYEQAAGLCELMTGLCHDEAAAWARSDARRGRDLRAYQSQLLPKADASVFAQASNAMIAVEPREPYLALAQLSVEWFTVEIGTEVAESMR